MSAPRASHDYAPGGVGAALEFLKRTRAELRSLRKVLVWKDRLEVFDINGDSFLVRGVGYLDGDVVPLLRSINAAFDPTTIHNAPQSDCKEFATGRRHTWAEDRVM
jgi:hypothetical protein